MQGSGEYPLSKLGREQASRAGGSLRALEPVLVASSDLARAIDTALLALGRNDRVDARLRERSAGPWEGRPRSDLENAHPGALEDDSRRPEGFETVASVVSRMQAASKNLLEVEGTVVAVTHGAVLRLLEKSLGGPGSRYAHLEALVLGPGLTLVGREAFLTSGATP